MLLRPLCLTILFVLAGMLPGYSQSNPEELLSAKNYFLLGAAKYKCNACEHAVEDFNKAIDIERDYAEAYYGRSLAFVCLLEYNKALADIKQAIRYNPEEVLYREMQGRIRSLSGDKRGAVSDFKRALEMDSLCWQAWYGLASENYAAVQLDESLIGYDEAIRLNPDFALGFIGKGRLLIDLANYPGALAHLARAIELEPSYALPYTYSSLANLNLEDYAGTLEMADSALKRDPELKMPYFYRGEAYFAQEQYADADIAYGEALQRDKNFAQAWYKRGRTLDLMGDLKPASKYYGKAIKKDPAAPDYYISRAVLLVKMEKPKKALEDYSKAILLDKNNVDLYVKRGFIRLELDNVGGAMEDFKIATGKDPNNGEAWLGYGNATYQNAQVRVACNHWRRAVQNGVAKAADQLAKYCNE